MAGKFGAKVPTSWDKEQAELLRRIDLAGGVCAADECQGAALDALIEAGFVALQPGDGVALTDAGLARAGELSPASRSTFLGRPCQQLRIS